MMRSESFLDGLRLGTVLGVWAHPDDDIYLSAGLMALAVRRGSRVVDVTATRGEGGSTDDERWPPETMGDVRQAELLRSLEVLGVTEHRFLGFPDVDMDTHLPESGADAVRDLMAEVRPDTVLTFGPEGMTGHVAHQDVSRWATEAFAAVAPPGARLYHATYTRSWVEEWLPRLAPFDIFRPGTPPIAEPHELAISLVLPPDLRELKVEAISAHESQVEGLLEVFGGDGLAEALGEEYFVLAAERAA